MYFKRRREASYDWYFASQPGEDNGCICIIDLNEGVSVTNDIENVLQTIQIDMINHMVHKPLKDHKIMYRDSTGTWDGVTWTGERAEFFPIQEKEESLALEKLIRYGESKK